MSAQDLRALFEAVAARRWDAATTAARTLALQEDRRGRHALARDLQRALEPPGTTDRITSQPAASLTPLHNDVSLDRVELSPPARKEIASLVREHRRADSLRARGLQPRRRILFHGPPGCGKSMTARALAHELKLAAFLVRYDAIIGAWLGQTAQRIRDVFQFAREVPAVVVIDEVDALTRSRGRTNDVGEMDRAVVALLQNLEHEAISGVLVATTNVAGQLDGALWRRFDLILEFPRPTAGALQEFARVRAQRLGLHLNGKLRRFAAAWTSYADVVRTLEDLTRTQILGDE